MRGLDDFDRMVMASLCLSGALVLPLLPPDGLTAAPHASRPTCPSTAPIPATAAIRF